jgi:hypothetical protein
MMGQFESRKVVDMRWFINGNWVWLRHTLIGFADGKGEGYVLIGVEDVNDEKVAIESERERLSVIKGLSEDFTLVSFINPSTREDHLYYVKKNNFAQGYDFFAHYLDAAQQPLFTSYKYATTDSVLPRAAYWATYCGYRLQDPDLTLRYAQIAMAYKPRAQYVLQYQCEAYQQQKRQAAYLETLREGLRSYPEYQYFFPRLADYYKAQNENDSLLVIADYGLQVNSKEPLFLLAKSIALLNLERYDECVSISKEMIALNDSLSEAHFNIATCYLNQALELEQKGEPRKHREELRKLYAAARPYMEKYRSLLPDDKKRWAPALYRIYLNLNMGKQF